jgi:hypothetical protein
VPGKENAGPRLRANPAKLQMTNVFEPIGAGNSHSVQTPVTRAQVEEWNLPTRPTKLTDTRAKRFGSATSVELDAIPADKLRQLVRACIERHVDKHQLSILRVAEESERELLKKWASTYAGARS